MSAQCIHCRQVRAKNTTRQRAHLLKCAAYLQARSGAAFQGPPDANGEPTDATTTAHTSLGFAPNPRINGTPTQPRPSLLPVVDSTPAHKKQKIRNTHEIPLRDVYAAFDELRPSGDDKPTTVRCRYCNQVRAKNMSRQREHLLSCPEYQTALKEKTPARNLLHQFEDEDVASSLAIPAPALDLDFRMSLRVKTKISVGASSFGKLGWISCVGGRWAGQWGEGVVLVRFSSMKPASNGKFPELKRPAARRTRYPDRGE